MEENWEEEERVDDDEETSPVDTGGIADQLRFGFYYCGVFHWKERDIKCRPSGAGGFFTCRTCKMFSILTKVQFQSKLLYFRDHHTLFRLNCQKKIFTRRSILFVYLSYLLTAKFMLHKIN